MRQGFSFFVAFFVFLILPRFSWGQDTFLIDFGPTNDDDGRATVSPDLDDLYWNSWRPVEGEREIKKGVK